MMPPPVGEEQLFFLLLLVGLIASAVVFFVGYTSGWRGGMKEARNIMLNVNQDQSFEQWMDKVRPWWREWLKVDRDGFQNESAATVSLMRQAWRAALAAGKEEG